MTAVDHGRQDRVLDWGGFPGRWEITRSRADTDGELLEMRFDIEDVPEEGPFVHTHPHAEERYEVVSGVLEVYVDGEWIAVTAVRNTPSLQARPIRSGTRPPSKS